MKTIATPAIILLGLFALFFACDDETIIPPDNVPPTCAITSPGAGESFLEGDTVLFAGTGTDSEDGVLSGQSLVWASDQDGPMGTGLSFDKHDLSLNTHVVTLTATDSDKESASSHVTIHINPATNESPIAECTSPEHGQSFLEQDVIIFSGVGTDHEDGVLPKDSLLWTSDQDGYLGRGMFCYLNGLSANTHHVTLTVTDSDGNSDSCAVTIHVLPLPPLVKVLFIGASYFSYNDLPGMFENLSAAGFKNVQIGEAIENGRMLDYHSTSLATEAKINQTDWDYVILQGVCTNAGYPEEEHIIFPPYVSHPLKPALELLRQKITANCDDTKMVYCMAWAFEDGTTWLPGYDDTYFDMQQKVYDNTILYSNEVGFVTAPVGWAWRAVLSEVTQLHYLHLPDWNHPSRRGSYLTACVIYSTIFQEDLDSFDYYAGLPEEEVTYFQSVAADIVLNDLELWNILP